MKKGVFMLCLAVCVLFAVSSVCAGDVNDTAIASDDADQVIEEINDDISELENQSGVLQSADEDIVSIDENSWFYDDVVWYDGSYSETDQVFLVLTDNDNPENITVQLCHDASSQVIFDDENPAEYTIEYSDCKNPIANVDLAILNNYNHKITKLTTDSNGTAIYNIPFNAEEFSFCVGFWYDESHVANFADISGTTLTAFNWGTWHNMNWINGTGENETNESQGGSGNNDDDSQLDPNNNGMISGNGSGNFTELQDMIDNAQRDSTITLEKDYVYDEGFDINGISIDKPLTIDGNNHIINANSKSRIFSCSYADIVLKNIIFVGGSTSDSGGAIYISKHNPTIENCKFINNSARYGGAIYSKDGNGYTLSISQSEFVNNKAYKGGAIYQISSNHYIETVDGEDYEHRDHSNLEITDNTKFINNSADFDGAAICMYLRCILFPDYNGELYLGKNITFEDNTGSSIISLSGPDFRINEANFINNHVSGSVIWVGDLVVNASIIKYPPGDCDFHDYYMDKVVFKDNSGKDIDGAISIDGDVIRVKFDSSYNGKGSVNLFSSHSSKDSRNDEWGVAVEGLESDFVNGVALFNINDIANVLPGKYLLEICYANNREASAIVPITLVKKVSTKLTANDVTATYNVNNDLTVTLKDANGAAISGAKISIDLNGVKTLTTDSNGQVKIATGSLAPNVYNAKITFAGDDNYVESSITVKVTVEKSTQKSDSGKSTTVKKQATKIIAKNKNFKAKMKTKKYTVTLKTNKNKAIQKANLFLKVKGKTYTAKTNSKGQAIFKIKNLKKKGTYKATVTFKGNNNYNKVTKTVIIKIK